VKFRRKGDYAWKELDIEPRVLKHLKGGSWASGAASSNRYRAQRKLQLPE
jgi:hypothetical protein